MTHGIFTIGIIRSYILRPVQATSTGFGPIFSFSISGTVTVLYLWVGGESGCLVLPCQ